MSRNCPDGVQGRHETVDKPSVSAESEESVVAFIALEWRAGGTGS